MNNAEKIAIL